MDSNEFSKILKLIKNKNILLLEDNYESLGSIYKNKKTGSLVLCLHQVCIPIIYPQLRWDDFY